MLFVSPISKETRPFYTLNSLKQNGREKGGAGRGNKVCVPSNILLQWTEPQMDQYARVALRFLLTIPLLELYKVCAPAVGL